MLWQHVALNCSTWIYPLDAPTQLTRLFQLSLAGPLVPGEMTEMEKDKPPTKKRKVEDACGPEPAFEKFVLLCLLCLPLFSSSGGAEHRSSPWHIALRAQEARCLPCLLHAVRCEMHDMSLNITQPLQAAYESDSQDWRGCLFISLFNLRESDKSWERVADVRSLWPIILRTIVNILWPYCVIREKEFVRLCSRSPGNQEVVECWNAALAGSRHKLVQGGSCNL